MTITSILRYGLVVAVLLPLFGAGLAFGQALSTVRGTVTDTTGAVVPGAEVTLVEVRTQVERRLLSDQYGNYEVADLNPGIYRLTVELPGFKTYVDERIQVESGQIRRVNARLEIGETTDLVTVTSGLEVITTEGASISTRMQAASLYKEVPHAHVHHGPAAMFSMLPGVQSTGWGIQAVGQTGSQATLSFDGLPNDRTGSQQDALHVNEEVVLRTVSVTAEQSRVVATEFISKSGDNRFRGEAWMQHSNSSLNARRYFDASKPVWKFWNYQIEGGGPIFRDKTFFYVSRGGEIHPGGSFRRATVPSSLMRQGDFSEQARAVIDPITGEPFPGNVIPPNRLHPTSLKIQELYYPEPNLGPAGALTNNFGMLHDYPTDKFKRFGPTMIRLDHQLTEANSLAFRVYWGATPYVLFSGLPGLDRTRKRAYQRWQVSNTHVFAPTLTNTFRFGWLRQGLEDGGTVDGFTQPPAQEAIDAIGLQGVNRLGLDAPGLPTFSISGLTTIERRGGGFLENHWDYQLDNSVTWARGRHVWKAGVQFYNWNDFNSFVGSPAFGNFSFDGVFTGIGYGDFLLGLPRSSQRLDPRVPRERSQNEFGLFLQDAFKITPKLTLDLGLRWDYYASPRFKDGLQFNWDPSTGNVIVPEEALSEVSPLYSPDINIVAGEVIPDPDLGNFRPRVGFAYRLGDETVIRGGYGAFTERIGYFSRSFGGGPFQIAETYFNEVDNGVPLFSFPNPFPADLAAAQIPSQSVSGYPMKTNHGTIHQFNLTVERQIRDLGLRASYIGSRSRGLNYSLNINKPEPSLIPFTADRRPFPQFVNTSFIREDGALNFNSMQLELTRRTGALTFRGHYTLSTNRGNYFNTQNPYDVTSHWADDNVFQRHRSVINMTYELPWGRGRTYLADAPPVVNHLVGGWKLMTVSYFATGSYFSPAFSGSDPSNTNSFGGLPDRVADGNLSRGDRSMELWFDPSAFVVPPEGRFGNASPNSLVGPGLNLHHVSFLKEFPVGERFLAKFTLAVSNIFNKGHFQNPRNNISTPGTGEIFNDFPDNHAEKRTARMLQGRLSISW